MRHPILLAAAVVTALLSACGAETMAVDPPDAPSGLAEAPFVVADGEVMVSCGGAGPGWPPSVMADGLQGVLSEVEARRIFQDILSDLMTGEEAALSRFRDGVNVDWRVLHEDDNSLAIGLGRWTTQGPMGDSADILWLEREGNEWWPAGWADCQLSPVLKDGNIWAEVTGYQSDAESARLTARVREHECTSGRDPGPFLHEPFVVETSESVTIYWTSEPPKGDQNCPGNPSVDRVVELNQALGTRLVFDGFSYPPAKLT